MSVRQWMLMMTAAMQGAGAGAAPWTPDSPTTDGGVSPHTYFDLETGLYQDSAKTTPVSAGDDPVGAEENQGSDAYDVVQATADNRPLYKTNVANGKPALLFDGLNDFLLGSFAGGVISQPHVTFVVAALTAAAVNDGVYHFMYDGDDAINRETIAQYADDTPDSWAAWSGGTWVRDGATDSDVHVFAFLVNGASSQLWMDGVSLGTGNTGAETIDGLRVGSGHFAGQLWKGYLAKRLIYPGNISTADKNQVGQYLADFYGLTWTDINP